MSFHIHCGQSIFHLTTFFYSLSICSFPMFFLLFFPTSSPLSPPLLLMYIFVRFAPKIYIKRRGPLSPPGKGIWLAFVDNARISEKKSTSTHCVRRSFGYFFPQPEDVIDRSHWLKEKIGHLFHSFFLFSFFTLLFLSFYSSLLPSLLSSLYSFFLLSLFFFSTFSFAFFLLCFSFVRIFFIYNLLYNVIS